MATGTTYAIPTYGEVTGHVNTAISAYHQDLAKKSYPLYISSAATKYMYSTDWTGALVITDYGTEIHGCIYFKATNTYTLTSNDIAKTKFVDFTLSMPAGISPYNFKNDYSGCLFSFEQNLFILKSQAGINISFASDRKTITISPRYLGAEWPFDSGRSYSITW